MLPLKRPNALFLQNIYTMLPCIIKPVIIILHECITSSGPSEEKFIWSGCLGEFMLGESGGMLPWEIF